MKSPVYLQMLKYHKYLFLTVRHFSKKFQREVGHDIISFSWNILDLILETNSTPNHSKYTPLVKASLNFDKLKMRLRFCYEEGEISHKRYGVILAHIKEVGSMLHGWLKWAESQKGGRA